MKRFYFALLVLIAISAAQVFATTPAATIDTLSKDSRGALEHYAAAWSVTAGSTPDTLIAPTFVRSVEILHVGSSGDSVMISYAQPGFTVKYSDTLTTVGASRLTDAGALGWQLKRIIVKAGSGTCKIRVYMKR